MRDTFKKKHQSRFVGLFISATKEFKFAVALGYFYIFYFSHCFLIEKRLLGTKPGQSGYLTISGF